MRNALSGVEYRVSWIYAERLQIMSSHEFYYSRVWLTFIFTLHRTGVRQLEYLKARIVDRGLNWIDFFFKKKISQTGIMFADVYTKSVILFTQDLDLIDFVQGVIGRPVYWRNAMRVVLLGEICIYDVEVCWRITFFLWLVRIFDAEFYQ